MTETSQVYEKFVDAMKGHGTERALTILEQHFSEEQKFHHLFEVLKMKARHELGLGITFNRPLESLPIQQRENFDQALLDACKVVGTHFWNQGHVGEGWAYLQPCPDRESVCEMFSQLEPTDENLEEFIGIAIGEGLDPARGFRTVLEKYGTCNAITTYDSNVVALDLKSQSSLAEILVAHFYNELHENLNETIRRESGAGPNETTIGELLVDREWLFTGAAYHIDTTHLASVVRIGRNSSETESIQKLIDLCAYGCSLDEGYHFQGEFPFVEYYDDHRRFFEALVDPTNSDQCIQYFLEKFRASEPDNMNPQLFWEFTSWLERLGKQSIALDFVLEFKLIEQGQVDWQQVIGLASATNRRSELANYCQKNGDLLGFAISHLESPIETSTIGQ